MNRRCDTDSLTPMPSPEERRYSYRIDLNNRVVSVSSQWLSFARENQATQLTEAAVSHHPLDQFIADAETRHIYQLILDKVRQTGCPVTVPFRCDGPSVRRFMELTVIPLANGDIEFESRLIREEKREEVPLFDPAVARSEELVVVCSWCKQVKANGRWVEVEDAVRMLGLFDAARMPRISHGICPQCLEQFHANFGIPKE